MDLVVKNPYDRFKIPKKKSKDPTFLTDEDKNRDYFTVRQGEFAISASLAVVFFEEMSLYCRIKMSAEFVCQVIYFYYICIHKR
jgi:hypothetical protein